MKLFDIDSYSFYKVIEIVIRAEDGLSRDVVKHLNQVGVWGGYRGEVWCVGEGG